MPLIAEKPASAGIDLKRHAGHFNAVATSYFYNRNIGPCDKAK
jgi:hypothetical protein